MLDRFSGIAEFVAAVEAGSFAEAGRRLGMTPSGVGKAVSRLEQRLGLRLLQRTTRRQVVTAEGAECFQRLRQFLVELEEMETIGGADRPLQGTLRMHLPPGLAHARVLPALPAFCRRHPGMTLNIILRNDLVDPGEEGVDLTVRIGNVEGANVISRGVGFADIITICSPAYARASGTPQQPEELLQHNCLRFLPRQTGRPRKWAFAQNGRTMELPVRGNLVVNNTDALVSAAIDGMGLAQIPGYAAEAALRDRRLVRVLEPFSIPPKEVSAVYSAALRSSPKVQAFVGLLREVLKSQPGAPAGTT